MCFHLIIFTFYSTILPPCSIESWAQLRHKNLPILTQGNNAIFKVKLVDHMNNSHISVLTCHQCQSHHLSFFFLSDLDESLPQYEGRVQNNLSTLVNEASPLIHFHDSALMQWFHTLLPKCVLYAKCKTIWILHFLCHNPLINEQHAPAHYGYNTAWKWWWWCVVHSFIWLLSHGG